MSVNFMTNAFPSVANESQLSAENTQVAPKTMRQASAILKRLSMISSLFCPTIWSCIIQQKHWRKALVFERKSVWLGPGITKDGTTILPAKEMFARAANFNGLLNLNYALIRSKAMKSAGV